nr:MAG TPA: GDPD protein [Caudoviricetes sp.]
MTVTTQNYDIDLEPTGHSPVVKMSQFDTGSRAIVFTVYHGHDLAQIDGMVARVDGTRSDGVEFSIACTIGTGGKVSFTISQEMTKCAGKHTAELVISDADGNPLGTQNFIVEVEPAPMVRDSAASADDRTLYDQFTASVSKTVTDKIGSVSKTVTDKIAQMDSNYADFTESMSSLYRPIDILGSFRGKALISHRGGTGYPEQSIAGCKWAVEHGFIPEVDVHLLADGTAVLCHDDTTARTMQAKKSGVPTAISKIANLSDWKTDYELRPAITGGRTDPSPTLEELLQACGNRGILNIEVKQLDTATLEETLRLIKAYHCEKSVIVASFSTSLMETAKERGFTTMCFADGTNGVSSVLGMTHKPDYCGISARTMSSSTLESLHDAGIKVTVWTVDDYATAQTALTGGYDGVTSNRIDYVTNRLRFEGGDILKDGLLRCATPYINNTLKPAPFNGKGLYSFGGGFGFAGYDSGSDAYAVIEPFDTMNIDLGDESKGKDGVFEVTVEGYTSGASYGSSTNRQSIVRLVLFSQDTPDAHWLDGGGKVSTAVQLFVRRNGQITVWVENNKATPHEIHSNYVTGSNQSTAKWATSSIVRYKLRVIYQSGHLSYNFCTPDGTTATGSAQFGINLTGLQKFALAADPKVDRQDYRLSVRKCPAGGFGTGR